MTLRTKNILYTVVMLAAVFVVWWLRRPHLTILQIEGSTMGTTYHISYFDQRERQLKPAVDSLMTVFNKSVSTFISDSEISTFNKTHSLHYTSPFFYPVLKKSAEVTKASGGAFDPTVMPLVNAWGFGPAKALNPDSAQVDSIRQFVGFDHLMFNADSVWKKDPRVQLDFSALAKGYGVDLVGQMFRQKGIENFLVEIGGEVVAHGKNIGTHHAWRVGILDPNTTPEEIHYLVDVSMNNDAVATSGNYFNYRIVNGRKFSHEIDPSLGYPIQRTVLSASVFTSDCMTADAWATAFMVMGFDRALTTLKDHPELQVLLVHSTPQGNELYVSDGLKSRVDQK